MGGSCWRQPFLVLLRSLSSCATLGAGGRCRSRLVVLVGWGGARRGRNRASAMRRTSRRRNVPSNWAAFLCVVGCLILLDGFQPSVAQASSEGWFGRVLGRGARFYFISEQAVHVGARTLRQAYWAPQPLNSPRSYLRPRETCGKVTDEAVSSAHRRTTRSGSACALAS